VGIVVETVWKKIGPNGLSTIAFDADSIARMSWEEFAACATFDPEIFFGTTARDERRAKGVCGTCSVRKECLVAALESGIDFGVWGGMNERERRTIRRRNGGRSDWRTYVAEVGMSRLTLRGA